jgi:hypothetical protein
MKRYLTFFVIALMTLGLVFLLMTKPRSAYDAPAEVPEPKETPDAGAAVASASASASGSASPVASTSGSAKPPAGKAMRVTMLGWELAAPGVFAAGEGAPVPVELAPETALDAVEARLARGGGDPAGADVAIVPLPAFVSSYERLRALDPRAFLVVGFSHGREELHANAGALTKPPAGADAVKVVGLAPSTASDATARAGGSESATVLGLFALDLLGVPPSRVSFVAPGAGDAKTALVAAIVRGVSDDRKLALSTADASRFVPIVAIAPKAVLDSRGAEVQKLARTWLDGVAKAKEDASGIARRLASKTDLRLAAGVGGAPEAIALVDRLGQIENVTDPLEASLIGENAKGAVTLETLTSRTWQLARAGGLTSIAAPDPLPIDARVVKAVVTAAPTPAPTPAPAPEGDAGKADAGAFAALPAASTPLVLYRAAADASPEAVAAQIAFLAGVFEHAGFRVQAKGGDKTARAIANEASDKHGVARTRLATAPGDPTGAFASVELVALP